MMNGFNSFPMGIFGFGGGGLSMILFWVVIIGGIIWFVSWMKNNSQSSSPENKQSAIDILKQRYAKGEISKKEFESMKKDIGAD